MKTKTTMLALLLMAATATQSVGQDGTIIGGAEWANYNVDSYQKFTEAIDDYGQHYQWGRDSGFAIDAPYPDASYWRYHSLAIIGHEWITPPCPQGWQLPTAAELRALHYSGNTWASANTGRGNSVNGRFYGPNHATCALPDNMAGCIFLPAGSGRNDFYPVPPVLSGNLGAQGLYWSSDYHVGEDTYALAFKQFPTYLNTSTPAIADTVPESRVHSTTAQQAFNLRCVRTPQHVSSSGVAWAATNLAAPGVFAARADTFTDFYQWSKGDVAWAATGNMVSGWTTTTINAATWAVNPCPSGWRLPTRNELQELADAPYMWANDYDGRGNEVSGMFFGERSAECTLPDDMAGCIFFPANGFRRPDNGILQQQGYNGYYWASTQQTATVGHGLGFDEWGGAGTRNPSKALAYNIRCVYDYPTTSTTSSTQSISPLSQIQASSYNANMQMYMMIEARMAAERKAATAKATLYPNPVVNGQLTIDNGELAIGEVTVLSTTGVVVRTQDFGSQTTGTLQLQGLQGTYFVRVGSTTQSIVVR